MFDTGRAQSTHLIDITLPDSTLIKIHNAAQTIEGYEFDGFQVSDFQNALSVIPNLQITSSVNQTLIDAAKTNGIIKSSVTISLYSILEDLTFRLMTGQISDTNLSDRWIDFDVLSFNSLLQQDLNVRNSRLCLNDLGDNRCQATLQTATGSVTGEISRKAFRDSFQTGATGYYKWGNLTFTTGANTGITREVLQWDNPSTTYFFLIPFPRRIVIGDNYSTYRGCLKTISDCINIYNNLLRFRSYAIYSPKVFSLTKRSEYPEVELSESDENDDRTDDSVIV